jgi:hypothetical protein
MDEIRKNTKLQPQKNRKTVCIRILYILKTGERSHPYPHQLNISILKAKREVTTEVRLLG